MSGPRPDRRPPRAGVQDERTALAWNRTGLALLGLAAVVIRLRLEGPGVLSIAAVAVCMLLAVGVLIGGIGRYRAAHSGGRVGIDGRFPVAVVALVVVLAVVELVGILR